MSDIELIKAEIERRKKRWMYDDLPIAMGRYYEDRDILSFIDSLPEDDPLNDPRFNDGFDAGRTVQRIFDGTDEDSLPEEPLIPSNSVGLEKAAENYIAPIENDEGLDYINFNGRDIKDAFIAGAKWMANQMPMPEDTVIFMKGVAEGRRLEREDRNDDNLPRFYGD